MRSGTGLLMGGVVLTLVGAGRALAADGLGIRPLSCAAVSPSERYGVSCQISSGYRDIDSRIEAVRRNKFGAITTVSVNPANFATEASKALTAGTQLVLDDGDYAANLTIRGTGTWNQPVIIRAKNPGRVRFVDGWSASGSVQPTQLAVLGTNVILSDLKFVNSRAFTPGQSVLTLGYPIYSTCSPKNTATCDADGYALCSASTPRCTDSCDCAGHVVTLNKCDQCMAVGLEMSNLGVAWDWRPQAWRQGDGILPQLTYLSVLGKDVTVAYSTFSDFDGPGHFIYSGFPDVGGAPAQLHIVRNLFKNRYFWSDRNGYELIQLGWSATQTRRMLGRVEDNVFQNSLVPGEDTELISIKSSDWIIRNNTFDNTMGNVVLRGADRVLVEGNYFLGGSIDFAMASSGVRVQGAGHWIVNNYFYKNAYIEPLYEPDSDEQWFYSVVVSAGDVDNVADTLANPNGTPVAKQTVIANNTFAYGTRNIALGAFYDPRPQGRNILPHGIVVANNVARTAPAASPAPEDQQRIVELPNYDSNEYGAAYLASHNFIDRNLFYQDLPTGNATGLEAIQASLETSADLKNFWDWPEWQHDGYVYLLQEPSKGLRSAKAIEMFPVVASGQFDLGAFQQQTPFRRPLGAQDVGCNGVWNSTNLLAETEAFDGAAWLTNRLVKFSDAPSLKNVGIAAPDGKLNTVETLKEDTTLGTHSIEQGISSNPSQVSTFSVYLRAGSRSAAMLYFESPPNSGNAISVRVDVTPNTATLSPISRSGSAPLGATAKLQRIDTNWFRVSLTGALSTTVTSGQVRAVTYLLPSFGGASSYSGASGTLHIWGAQFERDNVATVLRSNRPLNELVPLPAP